MTGPNKEVVTDRDTLGTLRGYLIGVLVGFLVLGGAAIWFWFEQDDTNDDLHALVAAEAHEEEVEDAESCVNQHERYRLLLQAIEEASGVGAVVGTDAHLDLLASTEAERHAAHTFIERRLPDALEPVLADYPPPGCDLEAAERFLEAEMENG